MNQGYGDVAVGGALCSSTELCRSYDRQLWCHIHRHILPNHFDLRRITLAITGVQKHSEAALLHVRVDGVVGRLMHCALYLATPSVSSSPLKPREHARASRLAR